jgi:hypothetical protein
MLFRPGSTTPVRRMQKRVPYCAGLFKPAGRFFVPVERGALVYSWSRPVRACQGKEGARLCYTEVAA